MEPLDIYSEIQVFVKNEIDNSIKSYADQAKFNVTQIPAHQHTGVDSNNVNFMDLDEKLFFLPYMIPNSDQTTSYGVVFIAPWACILKSVQESHLIAGSVNATLQIVKQTPGQGIGQGTNMLSSSISLTSTANTPVYGTLSEVKQDLNLKAGDRIKLTVSGTLTTLAGVCVTLQLSY